jgi:uncharacterized membrane protein
MSVTLAPSPWPLPSRAPGAFGRELPRHGGAGTPHAVRWLQRRHASITPRQVATAFASLCGVSLAIAAFFFWQGAPFVLAFTGAELGLVGLAMAILARHAGDRETLTLVGRSLLVEQCVGSRVQRTDFAAEWATVEPAAGQGSLVEICGHGRRVRVGRFLRPEFRAAFAHELRRALRRARHGAPPENDSN